MRTAVILFAMGIAGGLCLRSLPGITLLIPLLLCSLLMLVFPTVRLLGIGLLGFLWLVFRAQLILGQNFPAELEGEPVYITGIIASLPERRTYGIRFEFNVETIRDQAGRTYPGFGKLRLSWYAHAGVLRPGERWHLQVKLRRPHGYMNPGGFDYETWLFVHRIRGTGYVRASPVNSKLADTYHYLFHQLRFYIGTRLAALIDHDYYGLIRALVIGDRSAILPSQWSLLRKTGTGHLLAISGLHIGLVASMAFFLGRWLWSCCYRLTSLMPAHRFAAILSIVVGFFYAGLAGFSLPTQRALIMLSVCMLGILLGRQWRISWVIALALGVILIIYPFSLLAAEFWLSFFAVLIIVYVLSNRPYLGSRGLSLIRLQCIIPIALSPLSLFWFQEFALCAIVANLVAVPMATLLIMPAILFSSGIMFIFPALAERLLAYSALLFDGLFSYLDFLQGLPLSRWGHPAPSILALGLALVGVFILFSPRGILGKGLAWFWFLPLLYPPYTRPQLGEYTLYLLDVGQGLSAVIRTREHVLIYDTGPGRPEGFNTGRDIIVPFLRSQGIDYVDVLLLSHDDNDHIGGALAVLEGIEVGTLLTNSDKIHYPNRLPCLMGQHWEWDAVSFKILHPREGDAGSRNNRSCVLYLDHPGGSILLPGDIEEKAEEILLQRWGQQIQADILLAPHHGSMSSSTQAFVQAVSPKLVLFSAGYQNRFKLPKQAIIRRYHAIGARTYSSARSGALIMTVRAGEQGDQMARVEYRRAQRRFWHHYDD